MTWRNKLEGLTLAVAAAWLLFGTPVAASDDDVLRGRIEARLRAADFDQPVSVQVDVQGGSAVLTGFVPTVHDQWAVGRAARKESKRVQNHVSVRPIKDVPDSALGKEIERAVLRYPYYGVFDAVGYTVTDGKVTLTGSVNQPYHKSDIADRVSRVVGVRELASNIKVQPLSGFDDRLRRQAYRLIYGNQVFSRFAISSDPPVRILVADGHITLEGVVSTPLERQLLTALVGQVPSFGPVKNAVQIQKAKPARDTHEADFVV